MKRAAGILMYRKRGGDFEVFLVHPGGPFWKGKDEGAWSIPKGELSSGENPLLCARREFEEETGFPIDGNFIELGTFKQPSGKLVEAWMVEGDCDPAKLVSNEFEMDWPPRSGRKQRFPEVDRGGWFATADARQKMLRGQAAILDRFLELVANE